MLSQNMYQRRIYDPERNEAGETKSTSRKKQNKARTCGIKLPLKDFWCILHDIVGEPQSDILLVNETTASGICIEQEEHFYLLTHWGI